MRDPHTVPRLVAVPEAPAEPVPLPRCPVCGSAPERISWRQRPGRPVALVFDPCGDRYTAQAAPVLAVTPPVPAGSPVPARPPMRLSG
ncbi:MULTISPECIES: hypothetical protein [unclassified Streptomyces]|uniref:hypothetical protein n=1 Tax=unclassified Streptomyces TaxID=2593676 RepID=UPI0004C8D145|nr:hypothetical protein [Streptomyces sp. NRRL F-2747]